MGVKLNKFVTDKRCHKPLWCACWSGGERCCRLLLLLALCMLITTQPACKEAMPSSGLSADGYPSASLQWRHKKSPGGRVIQGTDERRLL